MTNTSSSPTPTCALALCLLLIGCSEPCYVKNADGSWREVKPGQWHYQVCARKS